MRFSALLLFASVATLSWSQDQGQPSGAPAPLSAPYPAAAPLPVLKSPVANLFIHPLLAFPERAFLSASRDESRMDEWFVTVEEFEKTLASLYAKNYILVRPSDVFQIGSEGVSLRAPEVPVGKKPLILSIDDLNYYSYMKTNGTVSRLWVDDRGSLATRTTLPDGTFRDDYSLEAPQVLETFCSTHPGFSFRGARGMIGLTGYNGILGWPTQVKGPFQAEAKKQAKAVVEKLKQMGWEFASHSYSHRLRARQDLGSWKVSEARWTLEVQDLVGETPYYILPFGEPWWKDPARWEVLKTNGFRVFFGVEPDSNLRWKEGLPILGRVPLDGRGLRHRFGKLNVFLNPKQVWDPLRPLRMKY